MANGFIRKKLEEDHLYNTLWKMFKRLPFGIKSAPEVFHNNFSKIFADILEVLIYIDDLIILANNETEFNKIYDKVLKRAIEYGIKFNKNKSQIKVKE